MTESEFIDFWNKTYPNSHPINHELKWVYPDRWFRIHNLPESKRYARSESEYTIILNRQNQLINDLIGEGSEIAISFGYYSDNLTENCEIEQTDFGAFHKSLTIDLHRERPNEFDEPTYFDVYVKIANWKNNSQDQMLKAIADDEFRAMVISLSTGLIIAPYDGGVDVITESKLETDKLKLKYKDWLSTREDGM